MLLDGTQPRPEVTNRKSVESLILLLVREIDNSFGLSDEAGNGVGPPTVQTLPQATKRGLSSRPGFRADGGSVATTGAGYRDRDEQGQSSSAGTTPDPRPWPREEPPTFRGESPRRHGIDLGRRRSEEGALSNRRRIWHKVSRWRRWIQWPRWSRRR